MPLAVLAPEASRHLPDCTPTTVPLEFSRLRALLRRTRFTAEPATLTVADLTLNEQTREVRRAGRPLDLTVTEFDLLHYLMANAGRVLPREVCQIHRPTSAPVVTIRAV